MLYAVSKAILMVINCKNYKAKYPDTIWLIAMYYEWIMKKTNTSKLSITLNRV